MTELMVLVCAYAGACEGEDAGAATQLPRHCQVPVRRLHPDEPRQPADRLEGRGMAPTPWPLLGGTPPTFLGGHSPYTLGAPPLPPPAGGALLRILQKVPVIEESGGELQQVCRRRVGCQPLFWVACDRVFS